MKKLTKLAQLLKVILLLSTVLFSLSTKATVILQYHHVSDSTPKSTSISPAQFQAHMQYLKDNNFTVVPLADVVNAVKNQKPLPDKTVAITFDDAYLNILENAQPTLNSFNYPFTIFINPAQVKLASKTFLSWEQLKVMADQGVTIANHGFDHHSVARKPADISISDWLKTQTELLLEAERIIEEKTGQSWRYFAYPYGEFTPAIQHWLAGLDFVGFSQQSGAVGIHADLTIIPRFPASQPYDKLTSLRDKLQSLPFNIKVVEHTTAENRGDNPKINDLEITPSNKDNAEHEVIDGVIFDQTLVNYDTLKAVTFDVEVKDFRKEQLNCYISGIGKQTLEWQSDSQFTITFNKPLPVGRTRSNCTAPSISKPGRYYWYSKQWFVLKPSGDWFRL